MGESQGAEDGVGGEGGEEPDEDQAGEKDEGRGEHRSLQQGLTNTGIVFSITNRGGKEREGK